MLADLIKELVTDRLLAYDCSSNMALESQWASIWRMVGFGNTKAYIKVNAFNGKINYNDNPLETKEVFSSTYKRHLFVVRSPWLKEASMLLATDIN